MSGADPMLLRQRALTAATTLGVDVAVERVRAASAGKPLVVMDVNSTLDAGRGDRDARGAGRLRPEVAAVTEAAMRGDLDFADSLRARVRLLAGLDEAALTGVRDDLVLARGARTSSAPSSGSTTASRWSAAVSPRSPTGWSRTWASTTRRPTPSRSWTAASPASCSVPWSTGPGRPTRWSGSPAEAGIPVAQTVAISDGANDLDMLAAGRADIAYNAKPVMRVAADAALNVPCLDAILFLCASPGGDEEADAPRASRCSRRRPEPGLPGRHPESPQPTPVVGQLHDRDRARFRPWRSPVRVMTTCSRVGLCPRSSFTGTSVAPTCSTLRPAGPPGRGPGRRRHRPDRRGATPGPPPRPLPGPTHRGHPGMVDPVHLAGEPAAGPLQVGPEGQRSAAGRGRWPPHRSPPCRGRPSRPGDAARCPAHIVPCAAATSSWRPRAPATGQSRPQPASSASSAVSRTAPGRGSSCAATFVRLAGGDGCRIAVVATASSLGQEILTRTTWCSASVGAGDVLRLRPESRTDADDPSRGAARRRRRGVHDRGRPRQADPGGRSSRSARRCGRRTCAAPWWAAPSAGASAWRTMIAFENGWTRLGRG